MKKKTFYGHFKCHFCEKKIKVEVEPSYEEGFPVLVDMGPPPRWGSIPTIKQHECGDGIHGVAELVAWSVEEPEPDGVTE